MAVGQASANAQTAEPVIARVVRAVTQPGGINVDWKRVRAAGSVIAGISVILGMRHRRWRYTHTFGVVLGIAAAALARLKDKYVRAPETSERGLRVIITVVNHWMTCAGVFLTRPGSRDDPPGARWVPLSNACDVCAVGVMGG